MIDEITLIFASENINIKNKNEKLVWIQLGSFTHK